MSAIRSSKTGGEGDPEADVHTTASPHAKRRKTRKGTHSCWACKRRKERCIFERSDRSTSADHAAAICLGCQRRGTRCVSQEFPDDFSAPSFGVPQMTDRMARIEALVERLVKRLDRNGETFASGGDRGLLPPPPLYVESVQQQYPPQRGSESRQATQNAFHVLRQDQSTASTDFASRDLESTADAPTSSTLGKHARLSRTLYESLPSPKDCEIITEARKRRFFMFIGILTMPYKTVKENGTAPESTPVRPGLHTHPVLIARYMLQLAQVLQQFHPNLDEEMKGLSEPPNEILKRLVDNAINLVTTRIQLLGSIEGLECVMLEIMYHINNGSLRLCWAASRRAVTLAQLMGFHQRESRLQYQILDPKSRSDPRLMWFRIVLYDRTLCLMLGLPQGTNDYSMADETTLADDIPLGRIERIHCVLAGRILERNESDPKSQDFALTQELDRELQKAERMFPSKWWLIPSLGINNNNNNNDDGGQDEESLFWDLKRLVDQMAHYNLLNRLHLPYMLRSSSEHNNFAYSKIACVNASREILSRFVVLRNFNRIAFSCRMADFMALMAAMTLLLAHLDSHRLSSQADNLLAHQYLSDRAMMEQVQESMEEVSRLNADEFSRQSADLLRRLLKIDAEAANGHTARAEGVSIQTHGANENEDSDGVVRVNIPYFGVVKIAREGTISKEIAPIPSSSSSLSSLSAHHPAVVPYENGQLPFPAPTTGLTSMGNPKRADAEEASAPRSSLQFTIPEGRGDNVSTGTIQATQPHDIQAHAVTTVSHGTSVAMDPQAQGGLFDPPLPGLIAGADDWTFQGVDLAFFDSLMGSADAGYLDAEMTWQNDAS